MAAPLASASLLLPPRRAVWTSPALKKQLVVRPPDLETDWMHCPPSPHAAWTFGLDHPSLDQQQDPASSEDTSVADVCIHIMHVVLRAVSRDHVFWPSLCSFPWNNPCQSCMTKESWHSCYPERSAMSLWTAKLPLYHHSFALQARWVWSYFILRDEILWCRECSGIAKWVAKNDMGGDLNRGRDKSFQAIPVLTEKELPYPNTTLYR